MQSFQRKSVEGLSPQYIQDCLTVKRYAEGAIYENTLL